MKPQFLIPAFAFVFFFFGSTAVAQIELKGKIIDQGTLLPLENASIYIQNTAIGSISNSDG